MNAKHILYTLFISALFGSFAMPLMAMQRDDVERPSIKSEQEAGSAGQSSASKKKKKKKKKSSLSVEEKERIAALKKQLNPQEVINKINDSCKHLSGYQKLEKYLRYLKALAHILLMQSLLDHRLGSIADLLGKAQGIEKKVTTPGGSFVQCFVQLECSSDLDISEYPSLGPGACFLCTPEEVAASLQILSTIKRGSAQADYPLIKELMSHSNPKVGLIGKIGLHQWYCMAIFNHTSNMTDVFDDTCSASVPRCMYQVAHREDFLPQFENYVPDFKHMCEKYGEFIAWYYGRKEIEGEMLGLIHMDEPGGKLRNEIKRLHAQYAPLKDAYAVLYKKVYDEIHTQIQDAMKINRREGVCFNLYKRSLKGIWHNKFAEEDMPGTIVFFAQQQSGEFEDPDNRWIGPCALQTTQVKKKPKKKKKSRRSGRPRTPEQMATHEHNKELESAGPAYSHEVVTGELSGESAKDSTPSYAQRVLDWFTIDVDSVGDNKQRYSVLYHSFSREADKYLIQHGIQTPWGNKIRADQIDTNYSLGGQIIYDDGTKGDVVFTICVDPQGTCYHRGFTKKHGNALIEEYAKNNYWQVAQENYDEHFPTLPKAQPKASQDRVQENPLLVRIRDERNKAELILYKPYNGHLRPH